MYHNASVQLLHKNTLGPHASAEQAAPMSAAVSGSPSRSEQQQQSLEDAWSCQLALLRQQHTLFAMTSTNTIVSKLRLHTFSLTAMAAAPAAVTKQQLLQPTHGAQADVISCAALMSGT